MNIIWDAIKRRLGVVFGTMAVVVLTAIIGSIIISPRFTSNVLLRIVTSASGSLDFINYQPDYSDRLMNTLAKYAESEVVAERLRLEFSARATPRIQTSILAKTELLEFSVAAETPEIARLMAARLTDMLVREGGNLVDSESGQLTSKLGREVETAQNDFVRAKTALELAASSVTTDTRLLDPLRRDADLMQRIYEKKIDQLGQWQLLRAAKAREFTVMSPATLPDRPSSPNIPLNIAIASALGLLAGLGMAVLYHKLDPTLQTTDMVRNAIRASAVASHAPVLGEVAHIDGPRTGSVRLFGMFSSQMQALLRASNVLAALPAEQKATTIGWTGAELGEGATTLAANFALSLAASGKRVLVIDADLQAPRLHSLFQLANYAGLSEVLGKDRAWADVLQRGPTSLSVMTAGNNINMASYTLTFERMKTLLEDLAAEFDYIVIDLPPVLADSGCLTLVRALDGVIVVARCMHTRASAFADMQNQLASVGARQLGVLINGIAPPPGYAGYGAKAAPSHSLLKMVRGLLRAARKPSTQIGQSPFEEGA